MRRFLLLLAAHLALLVALANAEAQLAKTSPRQPTKDGSDIIIGAKKPTEELKELEAEVEKLELTLKVSPGHVCSGYVPDSGPWMSMGGSCQKWGSSSISWCYVNEPGALARRGGGFFHASGTIPGKWFAPCENSADGFIDKLAYEQRVKADRLEARSLLTQQMTEAVEAARKAEADAKEAVYKVQSEIDSYQQNADLEDRNAKAASRACKARADNLQRKGREQIRRNAPWAVGKRTAAEDLRREEVIVKKKAKAAVGDAAHALGALLAAQAAEKAAEGKRAALAGSLKDAKDNREAADAARKKALTDLYRAEDAKSQANTKALLFSSQVDIAKAGLKTAKENREQQAARTKKTDKLANDMAQDANEAASKAEKASAEATEATAKKDKADDKEAQLGMLEQEALGKSSIARYRSDNVATQLLKDEFIINKTAELVQDKQSNWTIAQKSIK